jgi:DNA modification methylase
MIDIRLGDCRDLLKTLGDGSVDAIITDPPYPEITRDYGRMTEVAWHEMMRGVVAEARRVLKPSGSAVFILQPNSRKVGSMRPWLFEFQAWICREWNMIQDIYWWNFTALPKCGQVRQRALPRPSVKLCVWAGAPDCFRDIDRVLKPISETVRKADPDKQENSCPPSGWRGQVKPKFHRRSVMYRRAQERGGSTPFNLLSFANANSRTSAGAHGHGAGTPSHLCEWWTRYICPPDGAILDPFMGGGTTGLSALKYNCSYIGFEQMPRYFDIARARLDAAMAELPLFAADR